MEPISKQVPRATGNLLSTFDIPYHAPAQHPVVPDSSAAQSPDLAPILTQLSARTKNIAWPVTCPLFCYSAILFLHSLQYHHQRSCQDAIIVAAHLPLSR